MPTPSTEPSEPDPATVVTVTGTAPDPSWQLKEAPGVGVSAGVGAGVLPGCAGEGAGVLPGCAGEGAGVLPGCKSPPPQILNPTEFVSESEWNMNETVVPAGTCMEAGNALLSDEVPQYLVPESTCT